MLATTAIIALIPCFDGTCSLSWLTQALAKRLIRIQDMDTAHLKFQLLLYLPHELIGPAFFFLNLYPATDE